jgi:hypothetical protein
MKWTLSSLRLRARIAAITMAMVGVAVGLGCGAAANTSGGSSVVPDEGIVTTTGPSAGRAVMIEGLYGVETLNPDNVFPKVDVVVVGRVTEVLSLRDPRADPAAPAPTDPAAAFTFFKGYVLAVERQYGPTTVADEVTMWCRDSGDVVIGDERVSVQVSPGGVRLDAGDLVVAPLWRNEGSGTPLPADQYWLYAEPTLFTSSTKRGWRRGRS